MSIHQQAMIPASPEQVYAVLADADALSGLSGLSGKAGRSAGEEFSAFDGNVTGRQIELVPGTRIVQAWRFPRFQEGVYTIVHFTFTAAEGGTLPPLPAVWQGRETAARFLTEVVFRLVPEARFATTHANRQPAVGVYTRDNADGVWRAPAACWSSPSTATASLA
jgi:uncharacterized protein YndB with AHSA1/START domain